MAAQDFPAAVSALAGFLGKWAGRTRAISAGSWFRLQGIDRSNRVLGLDDLYFAEGAGHLRPRPGRPLRFASGERLNTGALRNCFFLPVLANHAQPMDLSLQVRFQGSFCITVYLTLGDAEPLALSEVIVRSERNEMEGVRLDLGPIALLPPGARLHWVAEARDEGGELLDAVWEGRAPSATEGRMVVLIRTFGRTRAVQALMRQLHDQSRAPGLNAMLANTAFVIYDASPDVDEASYAELAEYDRLNCMAVQGPNLGGGGNMSVEMLMVQKAIAAARVEVSELLLLDDDVQLSLETVARNWGSTLYRADNAFHTLPIFVQSDPRRIWEDGAFWGRYTQDNPTGARLSLSPRLLRHGVLFKGDAHLGKMAGLHHAEYSTFIFLSMPMGRLEEIGLPAAFFLRGDDIEFNLRHAAQGGITVSNPNLAAWHEPGHSHAQEYLSIAHGVVVNIAYGQDTPDELCAFFHARARAHLALADVAGLSVYAEVLADLVAGDRLMGPQFAATALAVIARFKSFDAAFGRIPDEIVDGLREAAQKRRQQVAVEPYLYMRGPTSDAELVKVVLHQPLTGRRMIYDPRETERIVALSTVAARLYAALSSFARDFDHWRDHYTRLLGETAQPAFWEAVVEGQTFRVLRG